MIPLLVKKKREKWILGNKMDVNLETIDERPQYEDVGGVDILEWDNMLGSLDVSNLPTPSSADPSQPKPGDPEFGEYAKKELSSVKRKMTKRKTKLFKEISKKSVTKEKAEALSKGFYDFVSIDEVDGVEYVHYGKDVVVVKKNGKFYADKNSEPFKEFLERLSLISGSPPITIQGQIETMAMDVSGVLPLDEETTQSVTRGAKGRLEDRLKELELPKPTGDDSDLRDVLLQGRRGDLRDAVRSATEKGILLDKQGNAILNLVRNEILSYEMKLSVYLQLTKTHQRKEWPSTW